MKLKPLISAAAAAGMLMLASAPAHALLVLDAWQLDLGGAAVTTDIGHLNMSGGGSTVSQEVGLGGVFVGAKFSEFGSILSITYTPNNVTGAGDFGDIGLISFPTAGDKLKIVFTGLAGAVDSVGPGAAFHYAFTPGVGTIELFRDPLVGADVLLANLLLVGPSNGSFGNAIGVVGATGSSTILSLVLASGYTSNLFRQSDASSLDPYVTGILAPGLFFNLVTQNTIKAAGAVGGCPFPLGPGGVGCVTASISSDGPADLLKVPEPGTLLLLGIGLAGLGLGGSRRKQVAA